MRKIVIIALLITIASGVGYIAHSKRAEKKEAERIAREAQQRADKHLQKQIDYMKRY